MSNINNKDTLERVRRLERRHTEVHAQLLQALDTLYLMKEDHQPFVLTKAQESQLENRHALHMSLDKGVAILKALKRSNLQIPSEDLEAANSKTNNLPPNTTIEDKFAAQLNQLSFEAFNMDEQVSQLWKKITPLSQEYNDHRIEFEQLKTKLHDVVKELPNDVIEEQTNDAESNGDTSSDPDLPLINENATLKELITALTHFSRQQKQE